MGVEKVMVGVAARLAQDARDARDVRDGIAEEDEKHGLALHVELLLELGEERRQLPLVHDAHVLLLGLAAHRVVAVERAVEALDGPVRLEPLLEHGRRRGVEPVAVLLVDEAVAEDALHLVHPEQQQRLAVRQRRAADHEHALEDLGQVAQVEGVVRLGRRRQQLELHALVDVDRGAHDLRRGAEQLCLSAGAVIWKIELE